MLLHWDRAENGSQSHQLLFSMELETTSTAEPKWNVCCVSADSSACLDELLSSSAPIQLREVLQTVYVKTIWHFAKQRRTENWQEIRVSFCRKIKYTNVHSGTHLTGKLTTSNIREKIFACVKEQYGVFSRPRLTITFVMQSSSCFCYWHSF